MKTYIYLVEKGEIWESGGKFYCTAPAWGISPANREGCSLEVYRGKVEVLK
jgi:hypothetical protein